VDNPNPNHLPTAIITEFDRAVAVMSRERAEDRTVPKLLDDSGLAFEVQAYASTPRRRGSPRRSYAFDGTLGFSVLSIGVSPDFTSGRDEAISEG
jgi:hypothetical protein